MRYYIAIATEELFTDERLLFIKNLNFSILSLYYTLFFRPLAIPLQWKGHTDEISFLSEEKWYLCLLVFISSIVHTNMTRIIISNVNEMCHPCYYDFSVEVLIVYCEWVLF